MKKIFLIAILCFPVCVLAQEPEVEVKSVITSLFAAMQKGDTATLRSLFDSSARLQTCIYSRRLNQYELREQSLESFIYEVGRIPKDSIKIEERILSYDIKTDDPLASVWTPYRFYLNDKLIHSGVNAFQLFHSPSGWRIIQITDTRKKNYILK